MNTNGSEGWEGQEEEIERRKLMQLIKKGKCVVFEGSPSSLSKLAFIQRPLSHFYPILLPDWPFSRLYGVFCSVRFSLTLCAQTFSDSKGSGEENSIFWILVKIWDFMRTFRRVVWIHSLLISDAQRSSSPSAGFNQLTTASLLFQFDFKFLRLFWLKKISSSTIK